MYNMFVNKVVNELYAWKVAIPHGYVRLYVDLRDPPRTVIINTNLFPFVVAF